MRRRDGGWLVTGWIVAGAAWLTMAGEYYWWLAAGWLDSGWLAAGWLMLSTHDVASFLGAVELVHVPHFDDLDACARRLPLPQPQKKTELFTKTGSGQT